MKIKLLEGSVHLQLSFRLIVQLSVPSVFFQRPKLRSASSLSTFLLHVLNVTQTSNKLQRAKS